jgi:hypothetical protein
MAALGQLGAMPSRRTVPNRWRRRGGRRPLTQLRAASRNAACKAVSSTLRNRERGRSLDGNRQCLPLADEHHQALTARHPRVDQVPLQHRVVLGAERDHYGWVLRALALVNCRRVGQHQLIEFAKAVGEIAAIEVDGESRLPPCRCATQRRGRRCRPPCRSRSRPA